MITQSWEREVRAGAKAARFRQAASSWRATVGKAAKLFLKKLTERIENTVDNCVGERSCNWRYACYSAGGEIAVRSAARTNHMTHPLSKFSAVEFTDRSGQRFESHGLRQRQEFAAFLRASDQARESAAPNAAFLREAPPPLGRGPVAYGPHVACGPQGSTRARGAAADAAEGSGAQPNPTATSGTEGANPQPPTTRRAPHIPRFADVPESAKYPNGPYRQAPEEFGGEWWLTNPFTGTEPWRTQGAAASQSGGGDATEPVDPDLVPLPDGFVEIFGERPRMADFDSRTEFTIAVGQWEQDLRHFKQAGAPPEFDPEKIGLASGVFAAWGLGEPKFYEGRYGWMARFPDSGFGDFEINANTAIEYTHQAVSSFQMRQLQQGVMPIVRHPYVPPGLFKPDTDSVLT